MKRVIFFIITMAAVFSADAQWKGRYATDEFTESKTPQVLYDLKTPTGFVRYLDNTLQVSLFYMSNDNFDLWWDIQFNNGGWLSYESDVDLHFIGSDEQDLSYRCTISNTKKDELYFTFYINDELGVLLELMKKNTKLNLRYYDAVEEQTKVIKLPLAGFTAQCKKVGLK